LSDSTKTPSPKQKATVSVGRWRSFQDIPDHSFIWDHSNIA